jgi:hypothetical protein
MFKNTLVRSKEAIQKEELYSIEHAMKMLLCAAEFAAERVHDIFGNQTQD